jgi:HD superfamily phosphohydrolase
MEYDGEDPPFGASQMANEAFLSTEAVQTREPATFSGLGLFRGDPGSQGKIHGKIINDPVHGTYRLSAESKVIFDTRQFQRLRRLKQLGMTYYVFPGASHNRFEHSLGVAHLASKFAQQLWSFQRAELPDVDRRDIQVVELAGLCHDLGHGPFSHVFEREFLKQKGISDWDHEDMSAMMLDFLVDENHIDVISEDDLKRVKQYITSGHGAGAEEAKSTKPTAGGSSKRWLSEVVANGRNSIDVDKFDYLARDALYCGVNLSCNFNRLMQFSKVIGDEICYKYTEYSNIYELLHARALMHRAVYTHKKAKAIEFMVVDALLEADKALRFSEDIWEPSGFVHLDDNLLDYVENFDFYGRAWSLKDDSASTHIASAQEIISKLRKRDLYKYVTDAPVLSEHLERGRWLAPTAQDIVNCYGGSDVKLNAADIIIQENKINYSMKDDNPLDHVHFYDYLESNEKRKLRPEQMSSMMMHDFEEKRLRVYSRNSDVRYVHAVHEAFEGWLRKMFGSGAITSTPAKTLKKERYNKISLSGVAVSGSQGSKVDQSSQQRKRLDFDGHLEDVKRIRQ